MEDSPRSCTHCGLPVPAALQRSEQEPAFCCHGCETAWHILRDDDELRDSLRSRLQVQNLDSLYAPMDHEAFQERYVEFVANDLRRIHLVVEGIYCSSCVFAIEKLPRFLPGVVDSRVNLTNSSVVIEWNQRQVSLSAIAMTLHQLGYAPHPADDDRFEDSDRHENRKRLIHLAVAGACAGNAMLIALALYSGVFSGMSEEHLRLFRWTSALVATISLAWPGSVFYRSAWRAIRTGTPHMDLPVAVGLTAGIGLGLANTLLGRGEIYFDSITVLVFLLLTGRYIQYTQQRRAVRQVSLLNALTPHVARRLAGDGVIETIPLDAIQVGDRLEVRSGDLIPVDGCIHAGESSIDCSILTGESIGVPVRSGDPVSAGTLNLSSPIVVVAERVAQNTRLAEITRLVEAGIQSKTPIVQFANAIGGYFVVTVLCLSVITFAWWAPVSLELAINHAMALLIVACPCALGLATPFTIAIAQARAARKQILIKSGDVFEHLQRTGSVWLDKTGTITEGRMKVLDWAGDDTIIPAVVAIEKQVVHPIATAITQHFEKELTESLPLAERIQTIPGVGIAGEVDGRPIAVGAATMIAAGNTSAAGELVERIRTYHQNGWTAVVVLVEGTLKAVCAVGDRIRPDAAESVTALRKAGWQVGLLSGDHQNVVSSVARRVEISTTTAFGQVTPEQKLAVVQKSTTAGTVVMVGDGVNDSAALAAASVGIAVHGGAAASLQAADVYINRPGLDGILMLIDGARKSMRTIRCNFVVSLSYNVIAAGLAMAGLINPLIAAILMPVSSLSALTIAFLNPAFRGVGK